MTSHGDYCLWVAGNSDTTSVKVNATGNIYSTGNSAIGLYGGTLIFTGIASSSAWFGYEQGGGVGYITNAYIESTYYSGYEEGDAISVYGGYPLTLDNITMHSVHPNSYSLSEQGYSYTVYLLSDCNANRQPSPLVNIVGANLVIQ